MHIARLPEVSNADGDAGDAKADTAAGPVLPPHGPLVDEAHDNWEDVFWIS